MYVAQLFRCNQSLNNLRMSLYGRTGRIFQKGICLRRVTFSRMISEDMNCCDQCARTKNQNTGDRH